MNERDRKITEIVSDIHRLLQSHATVANNTEAMNKQLDILLVNINNIKPLHVAISKCIRELKEHRQYVPVSSLQDYLNFLAGIYTCFNKYLNPPNEAGSQSVSIPPSALSQISRPDRVGYMLNNIPYCSVDNAELLLTQREVGMYDNRGAFIATFMKRSVEDDVRVNSICASMKNQSLESLRLLDYQADKSKSTAAAAATVTSDSIERYAPPDDCQVVKGPSFDEGNDSMNEIAREIISEKKLSEQEKQSRAAADKAAKTKQSVGTASVGTVAGTASATAASVKLDMFDEMMEDNFDSHLKWVEFVTYLARKAEPCQAHDRTEVEYVDQLKKYNKNDKIHEKVYQEMVRNKFIRSEDVERIKTLHNSLSASFESVNSRGNNVGQQPLRECAVDMLDKYKEHNERNKSSHVPKSEVACTMPYSEYRLLKSDTNKQSDNEITVTLQGNDGLRGFDATTSWGNNLVNWFWGLGSGDAAVQAFDPMHHIFVLQSTHCEMASSPKPPTIRTMFTAVDRRKSQVTVNSIRCMPLQFGEKTVECVFNPNLKQKIDSVSGASIRQPQDMPIICSYMPEVALNYFSNIDDIKSKGKLRRWNYLHSNFIQQCRSKIKGCTFFETAKSHKYEDGDIPDKITHMGIVWALCSAGRGALSVDETLPGIRLACPNVQPRNKGCSKKANWVVLSDMFDEKIRKSSECAKNIGFTCSGSGKERGDEGKAWEMFWTQKCLNTPCSFWSGDYLAVVATTAPGLVWGIVVNSIVTVWVTEGQRPPINEYDLGKIKAFVKGARSMDNPYEFFVSRINMLLEYLAFTFIHDIISLIRAPDIRAPDDKDHSEQHVALETILILCAALSTIVSSVELNIDKDGRFVPVVSIDDKYYNHITSELFDKLVPENPDTINENFCHENGIYNRESYFRKIIPLDALDEALNKHSVALWAYDYLSVYSDRPLQTTNMKKIFTLHCPQISTSNSKGKRKIGQENEDEATCLTKLNETFDSLDVLCIAKMIRSEQSSVPHLDDSYTEWFSTLCTNKLTEFLNRTHCKEIFCKLVQFELPEHLGRVNRLRKYLESELFPAAKMLLCQQKESSLEESIDMGESDEKPYPDTNPVKFVEDIKTAQTCSQEALDDMLPPLALNVQSGVRRPPPGQTKLQSHDSLPDVQTQLQMSEFLKYLTDNENTDSELPRIISEGYFDLLRLTPHEISRLSSPQGIALGILEKKHENKELDKKKYRQYNGQILDHIKRFNKRSKEGGSPTHTQRRRKLRRNHRRTQYTNKYKRSTKSTNRATIKHRKSYRKHNRTVKRRKSRRHH